jgi:Fic family protein
MLKMLEFLQDLDQDLRDALLKQLRNLWTHSSTALEGNTLTLGETAFVLEEGLTISGKPLKDHIEVTGHARAIDLLYRLTERGVDLTEHDLFALHRAVQTEQVIDVYKPVGAWKVEPNSTVIIDDDKQILFEYARPQDVPALMQLWLDFFAQTIKAINLDKDKALSCYAELHMAFVRIHPFWDGNGRMARLLANIPVLKAGFPPIIIPKERRREYIQALSTYHLAVGTITIGDDLLPATDKLDEFKRFCQESWRESIQLVYEVHQRQLKRGA